MTRTLQQELERLPADLEKKHQESVKQLERLRAATNTTGKDENAQLQETLDELKGSYDRMSDQVK